MGVGISLSHSVVAGGRVAQLGLGEYSIHFWLRGTPSLSWMGGVVPHPVLAGGWYPTWDWMKYQPCPGLDEVTPTPPPGLNGVHPPPGKDMRPVEVLCDGVLLPWKGHGTIGRIMEWRHYGMDMGPREQTDTCENSAFPILR